MARGLFLEQNSGREMLKLTVGAILSILSLSNVALAQVQEQAKGQTGDQQPPPGPAQPVPGQPTSGAAPSRLNESVDTDVRHIQVTLADLYDSAVFYGASEYSFALWLSLQAPLFALSAPAVCRGNALASSSVGHA